MQINRLFEIVYILLDKKTVTARALSEHFEVSQRTIYRDIEILSQTGIPIYTAKGRGGGISLVSEYVLNKSLLSDTEQNEIISALQSLNALNGRTADPVLNKMAVLFNKNSSNWIDVDFSHWGSDDKEKEKFQLVKAGILGRRVIDFDYYSSYGEKTNRSIEPLKLLFKGQSWYLYGYCRLKCEGRIFKITRIRNIRMNDETFERATPENIWTETDNGYESRTIDLVLRVDAEMAYRLYDEFSAEDIETNPDGNFIVKTRIPEGNWIYGYLMSYGEHLEVLEPEQIKMRIAQKYEKALKKYL